MFGSFWLALFFFFFVRSTGHSWPQMVHPPSQIPNHKKTALKNIQYGRKSKGNMLSTLTFRTWRQSPFYVTQCKRLVMLYLFFTLHLCIIWIVVLNHTNDKRMRWWVSISCVIFCLKDSTLHVFWQEVKIFKQKTYFFKGVI